jgi:hypothetical protein
MASSSPAPGTARALGDFLRGKIAECHGEVVPCHQEDIITEDFLSRHGEKAWAVVRYAFGPLGGMWNGAPVTVRRLAESQDDFFTRPLMEALGI